MNNIQTPNTHLEEYPSKDMKKLNSEISKIAPVSDNSVSSIDYARDQKNLNSVRYKCVSDECVLKLDILMKLNGIREKSALGVKVGLSREYISLLMNKKLKPTLDQAQQITGAFNIRVQDIFDLSDIRDLDFFKPKEDVKNGN